MSQHPVVLVFPGQGVQRPGMGKDFFDASAKSRLVFEEASDALGWDVAAVCFGGADKLRLTEFAQPCILATEIAMHREVAARADLPGDFFAGHSLGEYTALVAAGALPLAAAAVIVHRRGALMQRACPVGQGGMVAVLGQSLPVPDIQRVLSDLPVEVANINTPHQVVLSGLLSAMDEARERTAAVVGPEKPPRFVPLDVSAPFHSRHMSVAQEEFAEVLSAHAGLFDPERAVRVCANVTGGFHTASREEVISALVRQFDSAVLWADNMRAISLVDGRVFEIGPGRPLSGFFRAVGMPCESVTRHSQVENLLPERVL
ncbi:MAG: ACP S-malonyltransferase [Thermodesulfobacteriota bacterium]